MESIQNGAIPVIFSIWDLSDDYNQYAGTAILSLLMNTQSPIEIHLLYDSSLGFESPNYFINKLNYQSICDEYHAKLYFHHVNLPLWCSQLPGLRFFTLGSLYRLFIPDLFSSFNRVIYLDCDVILVGDISELYSLDMGDYCLGARKSPLYGKYFNSGVLLFDFNGPDRDRLINLSRNSLDYLSNNNKVLYPDQDALNSIFGDYYFHLGKKFNVFTEEHDIVENPLIFHFTWIKPWKIHQETNADYLFWEYYSMTPWGKDIRTFVKRVTSTSNFTSSHVQDSVNRLIVFSFLKRVGFLIRFIYMFIILNIRELCYKLFGWSV